jgi:KaiC/GvpD/RAD55 family RecA-like ATPase
MSPEGTGRVRTGIPALDDLLGGGFPRGSTVLVTGDSGTGKTILCMQYLYWGVVEENEPGIMVTFEERPKDLRRECLNFGWEIPELEEQGKLALVDVTSTRSGAPSRERYVAPRDMGVEALITTVYQIGREIGASRVAIDSIPALGIMYEDRSELRRNLFKLSNLLLEMGVTAIMTTEKPMGGYLGTYGFEEYLTRGVIALRIEEESGQLRRSMIIRKMRETNHSMARVPYEITSKGIEITPGGRLV